MDGGSTDGTLEVLHRYPHLQIYSQPDEGIYDALNKGAGLAHGNIIGFLNTDDRYEPDIFGIVVQQFSAHPEIVAVVGGASIYSENSQGERATVASFPCVPPNELLVRATQGAPIFNAWFFRKRLFEELGGFDNRYRYVADREFLIRMAFRENTFACLERTVYHYRMHPGSFTLSGQDSGEAGYMFESRALAERFLRLRSTSPETYRCFQDWHSQITAEQIRTAVHKRAFHRAFGYMLVGLRYNLGWPKVFWREAVKWLTESGEGSISN